jgi:opacity protein-like surface antigen
MTEETMKNWWCFKIGLLFLTSLSTYSQQIGLSVGKDVVEHKFFPEATIERNDIFYSYRTGLDAENLFILSTHYDFRETNNYGASIFLQDVFKLSFLNYVEFSYSKSTYDIVWAGALRNINKQLISSPTNMGFYNYDLHYFGIALGYNFKYFKKSKTAFYLSSNVLVQGKLLVSSQVDFSHRSFETGDPTGKAKEADARLTGFNIGLNTQHRAGYTFGKRFTPYVGVGLGVWVRSLSRSNEQHLAYLDSFERDYGDLYKVRSGPFPVVNLHFGVLFNIRSHNKSKKRK